MKLAKSTIEGAWQLTQFVMEMSVVGFKNGLRNPELSNRLDSLLVPFN